MALATEAMAVPPTVELAWAWTSQSAVEIEFGTAAATVTATLQRLLDERPCRLTASDIDLVDVIAAWFINCDIRYEVRDGVVTVVEDPSAGFRWVATIAAMLERSGLSAGAPVEFPVTAVTIACYSVSRDSLTREALTRDAAEVSWLLRAGTTSVLAGDGTLDTFAVDGDFAAGEAVAEVVESFLEPNISELDSEVLSRRRLLALCDSTVVSPFIFMGAFADGRLTPADAATIATILKHCGHLASHWSQLLDYAIAAWKPPAIATLQLPPIVI